MSVKMAKQGKPTSKFYLDFPQQKAEEESETEADESFSLESMNHANEAPLNVVLLEGERTVYKAEKIIKLHNDTSKAGMTGNLYCTNFRLSFVTHSIEEDSDECCRHKFIGSDDVVFSNISAIYQVSNDKTIKKLAPNKKFANAKGIHIHTKDVGIRYFSFELIEKKVTSHLMNAIQKFAFQQRHDLLFAHVFSPSAGPAVNGDNECKVMVDEWRPPTYSTRYDWDKELLRCKIQSKWRVTSVNSGFTISPLLPEHFIVPCTLDDEMLKHAAQHACKLPLWCYTHDNGCFLVSLLSSTPESVHTGKELLQSLTQTQPSSKGGTRPSMLEFDLKKRIPSMYDLKASFNKMFSICSPETVSEFHSNDNSIYSQMDSSQWLRYVAECLKLSDEFAMSIDRDSHSVAIREEGHADFTCIISSLVQMLLNESCRTIKGFQNIVQRCWVAAGHPFCERLGIIYTSNKNVTPVFLLFLDCVYQLTVQFPSMFEFSEIYLISLWDSCVTGLFNEFLYNCQSERFAPPHSPPRGPSQSVPTLPSAWSWDLQFGADFLSLFRNPLFELRLLQQAGSFQAIQQTRQKVLRPNFSPSQIDVWIGFFYRNSSSMQIVNGGKPAEYFQQCLLVEEITELQNKIAKLKQGRARTSGLYFNAHNPTGGAMASKLKSSYITSTFPFNNRINRNLSDISLCTLLDKSLVLSGDVEDEECIV
ncbi:MTMR12 [Bugula neritina]|uniref:MTMR12 n=1 Tax=Bugula neritina TaxID=10212 RepID=A0A7J7JA29_BUGNE|nr:MTMR12 [Bugula neritina]